MITGFFLQIFYAFVSFFVSILPTVAFPSALGSAITSIWGYMNALSFLFPIQTLLAVLGMAFTFHAALLTWRLFHLVAGYLRGN